MFASAVRFTLLTCRVSNFTAHSVYVDNYRCKSGCAHEREALAASLSVRPGHGRGSNRACSRVVGGVPWRRGGQYTADVSQGGTKEFKIRGMAMKDEHKGDEGRT